MTELFEGAEVVLGRQKYVVPALTIRQLKKYRKEIAVLPSLAGRDPTDEEVDGLLDVFHAAVSRNYPDLKREDLEDLIDLNNLPTLIKAVLAQSGLERVKPGEA